MQVQETSDWRDDGCTNNHCSGRVPGHCVMLPWICFDATPQARFPPRFVTATISCSSAFFLFFPRPLPAASSQARSQTQDKEK